MATRPWTPADAASTLYCDVLDTSTLTFPTSSTVSAIASKVGTIVLNQGGPAGYAAKNGAFALFGASSYRYLKTSTGLSAINATGPLTMWFVGAGGSGKSYTASMLLNGSGNDQHQIGTVNTGQIGSPSGGADLASTVTYGTNGNIVIVTWDGSSPVNEVLYADGTQLASQTRAAFTTQASTLQVLTNSNETTGAIDSVQGFGIITGVLTTADRQRLEGWAAWRYNLVANLPAGHPYKSAAPTVTTGGGTTVTGVGYANATVAGTVKAKVKAKKAGTQNASTYGVDKARAKAKGAGTQNASAYGTAKAGGTTYVYGGYGNGLYGMGRYSGPGTVVNGVGYQNASTTGNDRARLKAKPTGYINASLAGTRKVRVKTKGVGYSNVSAYGTLRAKVRFKAVGYANFSAIGLPKYRLRAHPIAKLNTSLFGPLKGRLRTKGVGYVNTSLFGRATTGQHNKIVVVATGLASANAYGRAKVRYSFRSRGYANATLYGSRRAYGQVRAFGLASSTQVGRMRVSTWAGVPGSTNKWSPIGGSSGGWTPVSLPSGAWH